MTAGGLAFVHRLRLREKACQYVVHDHVVLLLEARVRDARHHRELLVGVGQLLEEIVQYALVEAAAAAQGRPAEKVSQEGEVLDRARAAVQTTVCIQSEVHG